MLSLIYFQRKVLSAHRYSTVKSEKEGKLETAKEKTPRKPLKATNQRHVLFGWYLVEDLLESATQEHKKGETITTRTQYSTRQTYSLQ